MKFYFLLFFISTCSISNAQELTRFFPEPQEIIYQAGKLESDKFQLISSMDLDAVNYKLLHQIFPVKNEGIKSAQIIIEPLRENTAIKKVSGAYTLRIESDKIKISIFDQAALFYALKTLEHLVVKNNNIQLPFVQIKDYPDVLYRGTVEGFYGTPWSFDDRIRQLKFYGDHKMNTYIYGPKDDPYHSSPHWREAYPDDKASEIKKLVEAAHNNYVDFVWAVHPGKDIKWNYKDSVNLLNKFKKMYQLGVRAYAVFFDDIGGEGTKPEKQAAILNYLQKEFVEKYENVKPLIMCPTEYNKSWANPKSGTYLDILGDQLDPAIQIMWTGNRVISDIDPPTMKWINARIKRNAFIWWNFPVSDYVRDHLLMGPVYGNTNDIDTMVSGFVSNPMERAEASKIAIYGVAAYTWNMKKFDSEKAFDAAIQSLMPKDSWALKIFAENNSDLGPNGHGYRRTETVRMAPTIKKLEAEMINDAIDPNDFNTVKKYFDSISWSPIRITGQYATQHLVKEIKPWLHQFELLGLMGTQVLKAVQEFNKKTKSENWNAYLKANNYQRKIKFIDTVDNQNPYQPGIKTGSLVLMPFVNNTLKLIGNKILGNNSIDHNEAVKNEKLMTNVEQLTKQPLQITETAVNISPLLETVKMKPNDYFMLSWLDNRIAEQLRLNFDTKGFEKWGRIESSFDGTNWRDIKKKDTVYQRQITIPKDTRYIRFINFSDSMHQMYLKEFAVKTKNNYSSKDSSLVFDKNLETAILLQPSESVTLNINNDTKAVELFIENFGQEFELVDSNNKVLYKGNENFVRIKNINKNSSSQFKVVNKSGVAIRFVECVFQ
ncbi:MAG: hypothetical protein E6Q95_00725 [Chitinophagaceae bacterium]|nr:MAG: hypothetical protein E6Q95_00725 [Chitinophagaceae bacterium]